MGGFSFEPSEKIGQLKFNRLQIVVGWLFLIFQRFFLFCFKPPFYFLDILSGRH